MRRPLDTQVGRRTRNAAFEQSTADSRSADEGGEKTRGRAEVRFEDLLVQQAEALIVKGKDHGFLAPHEVLDGLPAIAADTPDQIFGLFAAFADGNRDHRLGWRGR